jgi:hypothetical protein
MSIQTQDQKEYNGDTCIARQLLWMVRMLDVVILFLLAAYIQIWWCLLLFALLLNIGWALFAKEQGLFLEWRIERRWNAICDRLKIKEVGKDPMDAELLELLSGVKVGTRYPEIRQLQGSEKNFTAIIKPFAGDEPKTYIKEAEVFKLQFQVDSVTFENVGGGRLKLRAGPLPIPKAYRWSERWSEQRSFPQNQAERSKLEPNPRQRKETREESLQASQQPEYMQPESAKTEVQLPEYRSEPSKQVPNMIQTVIGQLGADVSMNQTVNQVKYEMNINVDQELLQALLYTEGTQLREWSRRKSQASNQVSYRLTSPKKEV